MSTHLPPATGPSRSQVVSNLQVLDETASQLNVGRHPQHGEYHPVALSEANRGAGSSRQRYLVASKRSCECRCAVDSQWRQRAQETACTAWCRQSATTPHPQKALALPTEFTWVGLVDSLLS
jgi:hypothetical protein